ncbi:MAG: DUF3576 domain-containing protein [Magnetospirillum sp.]|nr:DUF3576 domain-containing protein [Magnetospirillum sp.]
MTRIRLAKAAAAAAVMCGVLSACGQGKAVYPDKDRGESTPVMSNEKKETVFGEEGLFGGKKKSQGDSSGISVNSFLWRATLDTLSFMPIASADPFGGTILTDWYQLPETPNERFKMNVFIVDRALRADGVKVTVFKQTHDASGQWIDAKVDPKMASDIENAILTRARQLRIVSAG